MDDRELPGRHEITFDVAYLLAEIQELKQIAEGRDLGTLPYLLECAGIEPSGRPPSNESNTQEMPGRFEPDEHVQTRDRRGSRVGPPASPFGPSE